MSRTNPSRASRAEPSANDVALSRYREIAAAQASTTPAAAAPVHRPGRCEQLLLDGAERTEQKMTENHLDAAGRELLQAVAATQRELAGMYAADPTLEGELGRRTMPLDLAAELCRYVPSLLRQVHQGRDPEASRAELQALLTRLHEQVMPAARRQVCPEHASETGARRISRHRTAAACFRVAELAEQVPAALVHARALPAVAPEAVELLEMAEALARRAREIQREIGLDYAPGLPAPAP